jgi:hypothetical protein
MSEEELNAMLEGEGEEVAFDFTPQKSASVDCNMLNNAQENGASFDQGIIREERVDIFEPVDEMELLPTQSQTSEARYKVGIVTLRFHVRCY